jgi:N-acetylglutamate synthase-like GNAT family acetyltransferase
MSRQDESWDFNMDVGFLMILRGTLADTVALRARVLGWAQPTIASDENRLARHIIAEVRGAVVGCGSAGPSPLGQEPAMRLWGVAVTPEHQGAGLGSQILTELLEHATRLGAPLVWANARKSALPFYLARGFQTVGEPFTDPLSGLTDFRIVRRLER